MAKNKPVLVRVDIATGAILESQLEQRYFAHYFTKERMEAHPGIQAGRKAKERWVAEREGTE